MKTSKKQTLTMNYNNPIELQEVAQREGLDFKCDTRNGHILVYSCTGETEFGRTASTSFWMVDNEIDDPKAWAESMRDSQRNTMNSADYYEGNDEYEGIDPNEEFEQFVRLAGGEEYQYDSSLDEESDVFDDLTDFMGRVDRVITNFEAMFAIS